MKKLIQHLILILISFSCFGQINLSFDSTGKMTKSNLPVALKIGEEVKFQVSTKKISDIHNRYNKWLEINRPDACVTPIWSSIYNINSNNVQFKTLFQTDSVWENYCNDLFFTNTTIPSKYKNIQSLEYLLKNGSIETQTNNITISNTKPLEIKITETLNDNIILSEHLKATRGKYVDWKEYYPVLDEINANYATTGHYIDSILTKTNIEYQLDIGKEKYPNIDSTLLEQLSKFEKYRILIDSIFHKVIASNRDWIKSWLWYTSGEIKLNPFEPTIKESTLKKLDNEITLVKEKIALLKSIVSTTTIYSDSNVPDIRHKQLEAKLVQYTKALDALEIAKKAAQKIDSNQKEWLEAHQKKSKVLYEGEFLVTNTDTINWLRHFDASVARSIKSDKTLKLISDDKQIPSLIEERDNVVAVIHNLTDDAIISLNTKKDTVKTGESSLANAISPFTNAMLTAFGGISGINTTFGAVSTILNGVVGGNSNLQGHAFMSQENTTELVINDIQRMIKFKNNYNDSIYKVIDNFNVRLLKSRNSSESLKLNDSLKKAKGYLINKVNFSTACPSCNYWLLINSKLPNPFGEESNGLFYQKVIDYLNENQLTQLTKIKFLYDLFKIEFTYDFNDAIDQFKTSKEQLKWLNEQTEPITALNLKKNDTPNYRTVSEIIDKEPESKSKKITNSITLKSKADTLISKEYSFRKYERNKLMPMAGISYILDDRNSGIYDPKTQTFQDAFEHTNFEPYVGVKWYLFGPPNLLYKGKDYKNVNKLGYCYLRKRGLNWERNRLALTFGAGVSQKILKNWYVGISYDLYPGLAIQYGANIIWQKQYDLKNGNVEKETEKPQFYSHCGLSIDLNVVSELVKLIRK